MRARFMSRIKRTITVSLLFALAWCLSSCRSAKPPAPVPPALGGAERLQAQATALSQQGNWAAAAVEWKKAADQYGLVNRVREQAICLHNEGEAEQEQTHYELARALFLTAGDLNQKAGRETGWWRNQIALLQTEAVLTNRIPELEKRFEELTPKARDLKDPVLHGLFLNELGLWQRTKKASTEAEQTLREAQQQFELAHEAGGVAASISNRALLAEDAGSYASAETLWRDALKRYEDLVEPAGIARSLAGLGRSLLKQNKSLPEAEDRLRRAAANLKLLNRSSEAAQALADLRECLKAQGKPVDSK